MMKLADLTYLPVHLIKHVLCSTENWTDENCVAHNFGIMTVVSAYVRLFIGGKVWGEVRVELSSKGQFYTMLTLHMLANA